jgi:hypothetical protein
MVVFVGERTEDGDRSRRMKRAGCEERDGIAKEKGEEQGRGVHLGERGRGKEMEPVRDEVRKKEGETFICWIS